MPDKRRSDQKRLPDKQSPARKSAGKRDSGRPSGPSSGVRVRKVAGEEAWELVPPRCARDRADDLQEVRAMIDGGELEIARDELRWLLGGCSEFIDAHHLLGELAMLENDLPLARGHFGYAFQMGAKAMRAAPPKTPFPYRLAANQPFYEAGKGLAWSLIQLNKADLAREVIEQMLERDASDPLAVRALLTAGTSLPPESAADIP